MLEYHLMHPVDIVLLHALNVEQLQTQMGLSKGHCNDEIFCQARSCDKWVKQGMTWIMQTPCHLLHQQMASLLLSNHLNLMTSLPYQKGCIVRSQNRHCSEQSPYQACFGQMCIGQHTDLLLFHTWYIGSSHPALPSWHKCRLMRWVEKKWHHMQHGSLHLTERVSPKMIRI